MERAAHQPGANDGSVDLDGANDVSLIQSKTASANAEHRGLEDLRLKADDVVQDLRWCRSPPRFVGEALGPRPQPEDVCV
jgi:hypothetical protein